MDNYLHGIIPPELGRLANLEKLDLHWNQLTGAIPTELGQLATLKHLRLFRQSVDGADPGGARPAGQP